MYSGFAVYSLERELSSLEKRKLAVKNKIDVVRKTGGAKNVDLARQLEAVRLPPISPRSRSCTPPVHAVQPQPVHTPVPEEDEISLPPLSPLKPQLEGETFPRPESVEKGMYGVLC